MIPTNSKRIPSIISSNLNDLHQFVFLLILMFGLIKRPYCLATWFSRHFTVIQSMYDVDGFSALDSNVYIIELLDIMFLNCFSDNELFDIYLENVDIREYYIPIKTSNAINDTILIAFLHRYISKNNIALNKMYI